jgi:hypothetical protein
MDNIHKFSSTLQQYSDRTPKDEQLRQLILTICSLPRGNEQRRKLVDRLLRQLQYLPKLLKSSHPDYLEAVDRTWEWLDNNLHKFNPQNSPLLDCLLTWINGNLGYRIRDLYIPKNRNTISLDYLEDSGFYIPTWSSLEAYIDEQLQTQKNQSLARAIARYIDRDPEQKLRNCHPQKRPDCNTQIIAQRLFLLQSPEKLSTIGRNLNINTQTIHSFWKRKGFPKVQAIAREIAQINS